MRFMLKITWNQAPTEEAMALMPAEQQRGMELAEQGIAEAAYMAADQSAEGWAAWAVWNCESRAAVDDVVKTLPMHAYFNYDVTPLAEPFAS
ncbi:MAG: muconolactone Delta-isomerase family protein [Chloroflexota bacterium]